MPRRKAVENYIRYVTLHFRDQCVVASLRYRNCAVITVLKCEQKPYLVFMAAQKLSGIMSVDTALENTEHDLDKIFSSYLWNTMHTWINKGFWFWEDVIDYFSFPWRPSPKNYNKSHTCRSYESEKKNVLISSFSAWGYATRRCWFVA